MLFITRSLIFLVGGLSFAFIIDPTLAALLQSRLASTRPIIINCREPFWTSYHYYKGLSGSKYYYNKQKKMTKIERHATFLSAGNSDSPKFIEEAHTLKRHEVAITLFYTSTIAVITGLVKFGPLNGKYISVMLINCWAGLLLGISFLEAWVKFKAPTLRKHVAVDVGRHIFRALNIVECAFHGGILAIAWVVRSAAGKNTSFLNMLTAGSIGQGRLTLLSLSAVLAFEVLVLTPLLTKRAKMMIITEASKDQSTKAIASALAASMGYSITHTPSGSTGAPPIPMPAFYWHFIYIVLEGVKVMLLINYGYHLQGS